MYHLGARDKGHGSLSAIAGGFALLRTLLCLAPGQRVKQNGNPFHGLFGRPDITVLSILRVHELRAAGGADVLRR